MLRGGARVAVRGGGAPWGRGSVGRGSVGRGSVGRGSVLAPPAPHPHVLPAIVCHAPRDDSLITGSPYLLRGP